jgi:putative DNA primase/helicase
MAGTRWKCTVCLTGYDESPHVCDLPAEVQRLAGVAPAPKRGPPPAPPIAQLWESTTEDDPQVRSYLAGRSLAAALDRGLCRCSAGRAEWYWLDRKANEGYRLAMALRGPDGQLVSLAVRAVVPLELKKQRMLNCAGIPSANTAFGDVEAAHTAPRVYLAEGIADTLALQLAGAVVVGAPGVDALSSLPRFLGYVSGREIVLCPQNDSEGSKARARASLLLAVVAKGLRENGARVLLLRTPAKHKDPADWLHAVGPDVFAAAVRDEPEEPVADELEQLDLGDESAPPEPPDNVVQLARRFALTDTGNAERLVALFGEDLRYCHDWGAWLVWDGTRWQRDSRSEIMLYAKATARAMRAEYDQETSRRRANPLLQRPDEYLSSLGQHAKKTESADRRRAMTMLAAAEKQVAVLAEQLDADPWALNVSNGTIDLRTGQLEPHARAALHTRLVPITFDPAATCPRWVQFLREIFVDNAETIEFIRRAVGYSLTGVTNEQAFFLCCGTGSNGKSTFLRIVESLLGEFSVAADFSTFAARDASPGAPRPDLVRLRSARLVTAFEPSLDTHFSEGTLKIITGEDPIVARSLNEREQQFMPVLKLWLVANHRPRVSDNSHGFWRRVRLIPFDYTTPEDKKDPELKAKLSDEMPGILNWALSGCMEWQRSRLGMPAAVAEATAEYRSDMDVIGRFFSEACIFDTDASTPSSQLYDHYKNWANNSGIKPISQTTFSMKLGNTALRKDKSKIGKFWRGIRILNAGDGSEKRGDG